MSGTAGSSDAPNYDAARNWWTDKSRRAARISLLVFGIAISGAALTIVVLTWFGLPSTCDTKTTQSFDMAGVSLGKQVVTTCSGPDLDVPLFLVLAAFGAALLLPELSSLTPWMKLKGQYGHRKPGKVPPKEVSEDAQHAAQAMEAT